MDISSKISQTKSIETIIICNWLQPVMSWIQDVTIEMDLEFHAQSTFYSSYYDCMLGEGCDYPTIPPK
jgi:hypothetical protein